MESLCISNCDSLTFIARRNPPPTLQRLEIGNCKNLQRLVDGEEDASSSSSAALSLSLKHLSIQNCPELTSLSSVIQLFEGLEQLYICDCRELELIPDGLHNLQGIWIEGCPSLVSLAERGLPNTISSVWIMDCEKLEGLPNDMHELNSLQNLWIEGCPSIVSFPEEGIPTNLTILGIGGNIKMLYKGLIWRGLHRLSSLAFLWVEGCDDQAGCFLDEEMPMMLLPSLTTLDLSRCSKLQTLSSMSFQSLTSLEHLEISHCPNLTSFPEVGLPFSLAKLHISECPKLKKECKRNKGKEWSKIAKIPSVYIDDKFIFDPDSG